MCTYVVLRSGLGEGYPLLNSVDYHPSPHIDLFFFAKKTQHNSLSLVLFFLFLLKIFLKTVTRSFHFWGDVCYKWLFVIRLFLSLIIKIMSNRIGSITIKYICVFCVWPTDGTKHLEPTKRMRDTCYLLTLPVIRVPQGKWSQPQPI